MDEPDGITVDSGEPYSHRQPHPDTEHTVDEETDQIISLPIDDVANTDILQGRPASSGSNISEEPPDSPDQQSAQIQNEIPNETQTSEVLQGTSDVAALIANAVQRYMSDSATSDSDTSALPDVPSTPGGAGQMSIVEEETIGESLEEYAPKLLQEARARVVSILAAQGQLKQAAGAENTSFPIHSEEETDDTPHLSISHPVEESTETDMVEKPSQDCGQKKSGPRFRDLFTRLRRLKNRSA